MSMIIYDAQVQAEINNLSFLMKMNLVKNKNSKFLISFNPIYINAFRKYYSNYSSNFIIKGFELVINDDIKSSHINIDLDEIIILIYDDFMIEMIKFISDFLTYNLKCDVKRKYKIRNEENKTIPKKSEMKVLNIKSCTIYDYISIKDLFTLKFGNLNYVLNDYINLPNFCVYHQNNSSMIKRKVKWFDITRFICKFFVDIKKIDIKFGPIIFDIYSFDLIHPLITISNYFIFFPFWINYHLNFKYRLDEDYKVLYFINFDKKDIISIKVEEIIIYLNENLIATCSILQGNKETVKMLQKTNFNQVNNSVNIEYNDKLIIEKLKEIKAHQIKIKINGFTLNQNTFFEREINKNFILEFEEESSEDEIISNKGNIIKSNYNKSNELENYILKDELFELEKKVNSIYQKSSSYYKKLSYVSNLSVDFNEINAYMEGIKILNLNKFKIIQSDSKILDQFDVNYLNCYSLSYKTHTIFYKEIKSHKVKNSFIEIFFNDVNLSLNDIKMIDKISYFAINLGKKIMSYPFRENELELLVDESPMEIKSMIYIYIENLEAIISSLDPLTGELYNKLYLRINYLALDNEKDKNRNKIELTMYYFSFGFNVDIEISNLDNDNDNIIKIRDYPVIILPLMEINIDGNVYRLNIPRNYMNKFSENKNNKKNIIKENTDKNIELKENNYKIKNKDLVNHYIGENKLDNFILNTQSLTIFINYHYLKVFTKIFENLYNRSLFIQKLFKNKTTNNNNKLNLNLNEKSNEPSFHGNLEYKKRKNRIHFYLDSQPNNNLFNKNKEKEENGNNKENKNNEKEIMKIILTLFDLKIIYLINYQDKYFSTFLYHPQVKKIGYFGFIIRLYSGILKYSNNSIDDIDNMTHGKLETELNLLTITSLNENNLEDEKYFIYDKDILNLKLKDYKDSKNFNKFMEFPYSNINKYKAINNILFNKNGLQVFDFFDNGLAIINAYYKELAFKFNETLIKMKEFQLKYDNMNNKELSETYAYLDDMKVTWNKMNMDMVGILFYEELLPITNSLLHKLSNNESDNMNLKENSINQINMKQNKTNSFINKKEIKLEESEESMCFIINNFQICIENEITNSKVLVSTKNEISLKIDKVCFNEKEKTFKMELMIKNFIFYIPPTLPSIDAHIINWIGFPHNSKYYLLEEKFNQIAILPNVFLQVKEIIKNDNIKTIYDEMIESFDFQNNNDNINIINNNYNIDIMNSSEEIQNEEEYIKSSSTIDIKIDKLNGEFKKEYFSCFMNIIKVFIFNRGDSYAQQKMDLDAKYKDLQNYKLIEIKNKIKENLNIKNNQIPKLVKEIRFELKEVSMTLIKNEKDYLKLLMNNLSGTQTIYEDFSSKLVINIQNCNIYDLQNPRNETLLSLQSYISTQKQQNVNKILNNSNTFYENKIEMLRFRLKDRYISIGTDSKWYVIQYLEIGILPLYLNISKSQCDFILKFFFNTDSSKSNLNDEEYKKLNDELSDEEGQTMKSEDNKIITKNNNTNKPEEPFYFHNFKVNDTKLNISFFFSPGSPWNFKNTKIKMNEFEKKDKFYSLTILITRFISHLKFMALSNLGNILSSFFFESDEKNNDINQIPIEQRLKEEEEKNKKLLFGNLYNQ